jgi:hypothetical protein
MKTTSTRVHIARLAVTSVLASMLVACGGGSESDSVGGPPDAGASDALDDGVLVTCAFETPLEFGLNGFVSEPGAIHRAAGCLTDTLFRYARWEQSTPRGTLSSIFCWSNPARCDPDSALAAVHESLSEPEVAAALAQTPPAIYGLDQRNVDDGMYVVRWGTPCLRLTTINGFDRGQGFDLGVPCEQGTPDCHAPASAAITLFVNRLKELEREKRSQPVCRGI